MQPALQQMKRSADLMRTDVIDLMQVHNLRDTEVHMASIREHAVRRANTVQRPDALHGRCHAAAGLGEMRQHKPDFIQINYSLGEREAEEQRVCPPPKNWALLF